PIGDQRVAPEIQGVDLKDWNADGQDYLRRRIREISEEVARGFKWDSSRPPYPGISSFDREDAAIFFGRDDEIREVGERLEGRRVQGGRRLLLVLGASGSGKSSVLKAGVLPQLARERSHWVVLPPFRPERSPLTSFAKCVAEGLGQPDGWRRWRDGLMTPDPVPLLQEVADDLRVGEARNATLLIAIDQFEEIFTIAGPEERTGFLNLLRLAIEPDRGLPCLVTGTVRADVLGEILRSHQFTLAFDDYTLRPMPIERLTKVVEGPASVAALSLEKELAQRIVADVKSTEALPLLAFALRELYERFARDHRLTIDDYEKLGDQPAGLRPIENAVRRRADDVLNTLHAEPVDLSALKQAFIPHLVGVRDDGT